MSTLTSRFGSKTVVLGVVIALLLANRVFAFQNEPDGFRGIKWGTNIAELKDMTLSQDDANSKYYIRKNDKLKIGDADLEKVVYGFYKGRFFAVAIPIKGRTNVSNIKDTFTQLYGPADPDRTDELHDNYWWYGAKVTVNVDYKWQVHETGSVYYMYIPIMNEREAERKEREAERKERAKKGASDL